MSKLKVTTIANVADSESTDVTNVINGSAKAWVNFNGTGTVAIRRSFNVSSITDNSTGNYTVNFTNPMPDANYNVTFGFQPDSLNFSGSVGTRVMNIAAQYTTNCVVYTGAQFPGGGSVFLDFNIVCISISH